MISPSVKHMQIWMARFPKEGSLQGGLRPCVVVSNDLANKHSPVITCCPTTTRRKKPLPTHVKLMAGNGLKADSTVLCEQIISLNKNDDLVCYLGSIDSPIVRQDLYRALKVQLGMMS